MVVSELAPSDAQDMPAPSAELVLYRVTMMALLRNMKRSAADAVLQDMAETLANEEAVSALIIPIRDPAGHSQVQRARRGAVAIFRQYLPIFVSALPPRK
jgi:hypothetical protein